MKKDINITNQDINENELFVDDIAIMAQEIEDCADTTIAITAQEIEDCADTTIAIMTQGTEDCVDTSNDNANVMPKQKKSKKVSARTKSSSKRKTAKKSPDVLQNGTKAELAELRTWLFKEKVNIENQKSDIAEQYAKLERTYQNFNAEMDSARADLDKKKGEFDKQKHFFDQKWEVLTRGFDELNDDKKKFEQDRLSFERERSEFHRMQTDFMQQRSTNPVDENSAIDLLFRGVNSPLALKKRYKDLMKIYHPDNQGGDNYVVQLISAEYAARCKNYDMPSSC